MAIDITSNDDGMPRTGRSTLTQSELDTFLEQLARIKNRDTQQVDEPNLVVHSADAHWIGEAETGNPSHIGLLPRVPTHTSEFLLQCIPSGKATDLQRHVHESIHYVISGHGYSEIGTQTVPWGAGDFVYTPPWIWHRHYADATADVQMVIIENSRLLDALDANLRESLGNVSFKEHFGGASIAPPS